MTDTSNDGMEFESSINFFFESVKKKNPNYFELLGIPTNATHKDIENAYFNYASEFDVDKIAAIKNPEIKKKADYLVHQGKRAYEVLTNFEKRADYEKKGFREFDPDAVKEDEPEEKAKIIFRKAKTFLVQKNYRNVVLAMKEAIQYDSKKADYYLMMGNAQAQIPEMKREAEVSLLKASELEAWNVEPIVALGLLFHAERLYKKAEVQYRKALEIQNDHAVARKKLEEIVGPEASGFQKAVAIFKNGLQKGLGTVFPSFFGKKKK